MIVNYNDPSVRICGRTLERSGCVYLDYTCSFAEFEFEGSRAAATILSDLCPAEEQYRAWIGIFIDGVLDRKLRLDQKENVVTLYEGECRKVRVRIMKLSEAAFAKCGLKCIEIDGRMNALSGEQPERLIEFVGDSITCGYGIDGKYEGGTFSTETENPLKGYAFLTAGKCRSRFRFVSWSGMGVMTAYVDETAEKPLDDWLFKDIFPYTDSPLERSMGVERGKYTPYDGKDQPQVVVFADGTNDHSWTKGIPEREADFERAYARMLDLIREKYPDTYIVCTYGVMGDSLKDAIARQTESFKQRHDDRICFVLLDVQDEKNDGVAVDWHPSAITHEKMADVLSKKINSLFEDMGL